MPTRSPFPGVKAPLDDLDNIRKGTRVQYVSEWVKIPHEGSSEFTHELSEIPWLVSVIKSRSEGGDSPSEISTSIDALHGTVITVGKSDTTITVTNNDFTQETYFQVRAL
jgi:hypothetical protein